jgi:hypothetical protein
VVLGIYIIFPESIAVRAGEVRAYPLDEGSLPEKEKQKGSDFLGNKEFAVEETKGDHRYAEKTDDQGDEEIPDQLGFGGGNNHWATFLPI